MSIETLKKKTQARYNNNSVSEKNFSINGTLRSAGWVGQTSLSQIGNLDVKYRQPANVSISEEYNLNNSAVIKPSVLSNTGMLATKYRWLRRPYPFSTVKPDDTLNNSTQSDYITRLKQSTIAAIKCCSITPVVVEITPPANPEITALSSTYYSITLSFSESSTQNLINYTVNITNVDVEGVPPISFTVSNTSKLNTLTFGTTDTPAVTPGTNYSVYVAANYTDAVTMNSASLEIQTEVPIPVTTTVTDLAAAGIVIPTGVPVGAVVFAVTVVNVQAAPDGTVVAFTGYTVTLTPIDANGHPLLDSNGNPISIVLPSTPTAPPIITNVATTSNATTLTFAESVTDGIVEYIAYAAPATGTTLSTVLNDTAVAPITINELAPGTTYGVSVVAYYDTSYTSVAVASNIQNTTTLAASPPTFVATATQSLLDISYTSIYNVGEIASFTVVVGSANLSIASPTIPFDVQIGGLDAGTVYYPVVTAIYTTGVHLVSDPHPVATIAQLNILVTPSANSASIAISDTDATSIYNPILHYIAIVQDTNLTTVYTNSNIPASTTTYVIPGLADNTSYNLSLTAVYAAIQIVQDVVFATTPLPAAPMVTTLTTNNTSVQLAEHNPEGLVGYQIIITPFNQPPQTINVSFLLPVIDVAPTTTSSTIVVTASETFSTNLTSLYATATLASNPAATAHQSNVDSVAPFLSDAFTISGLSPNTSYSVVIVATYVVTLNVTINSVVTPIQESFLITSVPVLATTAA